MLEEGEVERDNAFVSDMECRCEEQKLSSKNSRFAAVASNMGDILKWKDTSS
jgi:hypothetical protein